MRIPVLALPLLLLAGAGAARADTLALVDGRFVHAESITAEKEGYRIRYENGEIVVPLSLVSDYFKEAPDGAFEPRTPEEKAKAERGLVPWDGRWVSRQYRDRKVEQQREERKKRIEQMEARRLWRNHAVVKSRRWEFHHTLPDDVFDDLKFQFDAFFEFYTKYWRIRPPAKFGKPTINLYHSREYFHQVSGAPAGVAGYYSPRDRDLHFYFDREHRDFSVDVMFHETSHLLTHMIAPDVRYPTWLNEGMAEVFGAASYDPEKQGLSIGRVQSGRLAVLQSQIEDDGWMQLETLLRAPSISALGYAWAWSFCHFCITSPKYEKGFRKYFLAIGRSSHIERRYAMPGMKTVDTDESIEALCRYLKVKDLKDLQAEWYAWLKDLLKRADLDYHQAGFIMDLHGEKRKAREFFKKAIDAGSKNAYDYYMYARLQYARGKVGVAYKRCKEALALDPLHPRALALLGLCTYEKEDQDEGMRLVRLARELAPDDEKVWYVEAMLEEHERENKAGG
jgi:hypothetical protein